MPKTKEQFEAIEEDINEDISGSKSSHENKGNSNKKVESSGSEKYNDFVTSNVNASFKRASRLSNTDEIQEDIHFDGGDESYN